MAGPGAFPKVTGDITYQSDYNTIQSMIADVVGTYYGNSLSSSQLSGNPIMSAAHFDNLRLDLNKGYRHIVGSNPSLTDVAPGNLPTAAVLNAYKSTADYCSSNRESISAAQRTLTTLRSNSLTAAWNGMRDFTTRLSWNSAAAATVWWQTQSRIRVDVSQDGSLGTAKDQAWATILSTVGIANYYTKANWDAGGEVNIRLVYGTNIKYSENYCQVYFNKVNSNTLDILVRLNDADVGDKTGTGPAVDENVNTNAYATIFFNQSYDAITVTNPAWGAVSNW